MMGKAKKNRAKYQKLLEKQYGKEEAARLIEDIKKRKKEKKNEN